MYYTKYRSQKFSELVKPNDVAEALSKQVLTGKTVHAYLFVGPRGTGKTSTARILSKALNCQHISKIGDPCGECDVCKAIQEGNYMDLHEIDAASNRGIDDIRELKDKIKLAPSVGKNKIYIIDEVHMLTQEAFNALLKTLEEPPKNTVFILCTTELHKVPETIKSRCQLYKFKRATSAQIVEKLSNIAKLEKVKVAKEDLEKIARASVGGYRDAETLLQQVVEGEINVDSLININSKHKFQDLVELLWEKDLKSSLELVTSVYEDGMDMYVWVGELLRYYRSLILLKAGVSSEMLDYPEELFENKKLFSVLTNSWLVQCIESFSKAYTEVKLSYIPQLPIEVAILNIIGNATSSKNKIDTPKEPINDLPKGDTSKKSVLDGKTKEPTTKETLPVDTHEEMVVTAAIVEDIPTNDLENTDSSTGINTDSQITLDFITEKWADILAKVRGINSSVQALLKSGKPSSIQGRFIILEVYYAFHKERLESPKNRNIIEKAMTELLGMPLSIKCELTETKPKHLADKEVGVLTDYNVVVPGGDKYDRDKVISMLDGGLPL